jgi:hypothetical protein
MSPPTSPDLLNDARKYIRRRQRLLIRGESTPRFPVERCLLFHIVPESFDANSAEVGVRGFSPSNLVPHVKAADWKGRYTRHGYRSDLATADRRAFLGLLRSGAVEFCIVPAGTNGIDWDTVQWVFTESLYELARYVWAGSTNPTTAFLSLLVTGATEQGIVGLPPEFTRESPNAFEEESLRLGPLLLNAEGAGTRQFQPMFNLLFQCAGFRAAPGLLEL